MKHALNAFVVLSCCLILQSCAGLPEATEETPPVAGSLQVTWSVHVDQRRPLSPAANSFPAVSEEHIVLGAGDRRVHVYNSHGSEVRRIALHAPCESGALSIGDNLVILGDTDGYLYGVDPVQGTIVWQQLLSSVLLGRPVQAGDNFLVQTADSRVYSFNRKGEKQWSYAGQVGGLAMTQGSSPLVSGTRAYALFSNGNVVAIDLKTGNLAWRRQLILDISAVVLREMRVPVADPVMVAGKLIISFFQGEITALNPEDGEQQWNRKISLKSTPMVQKDRLFVASGDGDVFALDAASGEGIWRQHVSAAALVGPVASQGRLIVADEKGHVHALTFEGQAAGQLELPGRVDRAPVKAPEGLIFRNDLGGMYLIH